MRHFPQRIVDGICSNALVVSIQVLGGFVVSGAAKASSTEAYPQYTEAACILIANQMARFKQQPDLLSYQNATHNRIEQPIRIKGGSGWPAT